MPYYATLPQHHWTRNGFIDSIGITMKRYQVRRKIEIVLLDYPISLNIALLWPKVLPGYGKVPSTRKMARPWPRQPAFSNRNLNGRYDGAPDVPHLSGADSGELAIVNVPSLPWEDTRN